MTLQPGQELGDFVVEALIGSGGMGSVYRAHDTRHGRTVALKVLDGDVRAADAGAEARFAREARAIGDVAHPAIARVHHSGVDDGVAWISMQYVDGTDLAELLSEQGPGRLTSVIRILAPIAEALDELHGARRDGPGTEQRIHRDIKPANIIVAPWGTPGPAATLVDFGIARRAVDEDRLTATTSITGTQGYVAPEAFAPDGDLRGPAADQYSLAVVAYRALTGRLPLPDAVLTPDVHARYGETLTPPSSLVPGVPPAADEVLARALRTDPAERFPTCRAFVGALRAAAGTNPGSAASPEARRSTGDQTPDTTARTRTASRPSTGSRPATARVTGPSAVPASALASAGRSTRPHGRSPAGGRPRTGRYLAAGALAGLLVGAVIAVPLLLTELNPETMPREARAAFPGLVPVTDADSGYGDTDCTAEAGEEGTVASVACASGDLAYRVYVFASPERRDSAAAADEGEATVLSAGGTCSVRVVDSGRPAPAGHRHLTVVPEDDRRTALLLATVPADSRESALTWASTAPLCPETS